MGELFWTAFAFSPHFLSDVSRVQATLLAPRKPFWTNGKWTEKEQRVEWSPLIAELPKPNREKSPFSWEWPTLCFAASPPHERSSLIAFFEPDPSIMGHMSFVTCFWKILQFLHDHDRDPATDKTPDHPLWEFAFERCEMFVVGASPTYKHRRSRNLGPGVVLVFQPRSLFIDPATSQPIAASVRHRIHRRMTAYDGMTVHPDIGFYGNFGNREWKQYALPDDNEPEAGACPFQTRT